MRLKRNLRVDSSAVPAEGAVESERNERNDNDRKYCMAGQNRKVDWARQTRPLKTRRAVVVVVSEIRSEKKKRDDERTHLTRPVSSNIP